MLARARDIRKIKDRHVYFETARHSRTQKNSNSIALTHITSGAMVSRVSANVQAILIAGLMRLDLRSSDVTITDVAQRLTNTLID